MIILMPIDVGVVLLLHSQADNLRQQEKIWSEGYLYMVSFVMNREEERKKQEDALN